MPERNVRIRANTLHTPIWNFRHHTTDSRISLVGMMHVGDQSYYDSIAEHVAATETWGNVVHYEMVKRPEGDGALMLPEGFDKFADFADDMQIPTTIVTKYIGGVGQKEALTYAPHWENHDLALAEMMVMLGPDILEKMKEKFQKMKKLDEENPVLAEKMIRASFRVGTRIPEVARRRKNDRYIEVVRNHRNGIAVRAVKECIAVEPDRGVTMLWGSNHLPGIKQGLERFGYRRTSTKWLAALSLDRVANTVE